jgi:glycerol-3-phosphate dehydrogenase (NAD(P)+)
VDTADERPVAVLGAGSWGTALTLLLAQSQTGVRLWDRSPEQVIALHEAGQNRRYLPGHSLPSGIGLTADLQEAVTGAGCVVIAIPLSGLESVLAHAAPHIAPGTDIVLAAKGMDPQRLQLPSQLARSAAPHALLTALSGPNLASEVARGVPTAAVAASDDPAAAQRIAERFNRPTFRVYVSTDLLGVELGGAMKNVLAIAGGVSDGLGYGDNTKAALLTRGLGEMARLGHALGAQRETFYGLAGVGDLMATAVSRLSRNWRVGEGLARGERLEALLSRLGQVAEGVPTAAAIARLATERGIALPVFLAVHRLLQGELTPREAVAVLTENRNARTE